MPVSTRPIRGGRSGVGLISSETYRKKSSGRGWGWVGVFRKFSLPIQHIPGNHACFWHTIVPTLKAQALLPEIVRPKVVSLHAEAMTCQRGDDVGENAGEGDRRVRQEPAGMGEPGCLVDLPQLAVGRVQDCPIARLRVGLVIRGNASLVGIPKRLAQALVGVVVNAVELKFASTQVVRGDASVSAGVKHD